MKATEAEREISIGIVDDENWEPDKDFLVQLTTNDMAQAALEGEDTQTRVTIIDNDNPGTLGFSQRNVIVRPRDEICSLEIERQDGSSGQVSCEIFVTSNNAALGGRPAVKGVDFLDMDNPRIEFKTGETQKTAHILMPKTSVVEADEKDKKTAGDGEEKDEPESAFFMVELTSPQPEGLRLSRKNICFVEIRPQSQATDKVLEEQRAEMVKHFLSGDSSNISWGYQFL